MKKILYMLCFFFLSFIFISTVNATNYVNNVFMVSLDGNNFINYDEEVIINININVFYNLSSVIGNIEYDNSKLELVKCESEFFVCTFSNDKILLDSIEGIEGNKNIAKLTFKVLNKFKPNDDTEIFLTNVNGNDNTKGNNTKFKIHRFENDNNLTSLVVKDETLVPNFTPDNTIYNLRTKKKSINIEATSKSKIFNTGEKKLKIGNNNFEIIVKAENGEEKKYIINVYREENNDNETSTTNKDSNNKDDVLIDNNNETSASNKDSNNNKNDVLIDNNKEQITDNENKTLSSNKKLKYLKISGIDVEFKNDLYEYNITVNSEVKELNIDYELEDKKSKVVISGDTKFSKEENLVVISVIAEDGSQLNYRIKILKKDNNNNISVEDDTNKSNNKNFNNYDKVSNSNNNLIIISKMIMFIILIISVIVLKKVVSKK